MKTKIKVIPFLSKPIDLFLFAIVLFLLISGCKSSEISSKTVHVYCSLAQVFSEPLLKEFERKTGISVKAKYDVEAVKTVGLINAIIAEKENPRCDVLWNNEVIQTINLKRMNLLQPYKSPSADSIPDEFKDTDGYWTGIAARARVIIYNKQKLSPDEIPNSIHDFLKPKNRNKATIALPLFGTTATHAAALFSFWGKEKSIDFFKALRNNNIVISSGNAMVKDKVASGEFAFGLTDTDDANIAILDGKPVGIIFPDQKTIGTLILPNSIAIIKGCPHPKEAKILVDYLLSNEVEEKLAYGRPAQMPLHKDINEPQGMPDISEINSMKINYEELADIYDQSLEAMKEIFLK
ncbi:MAG: extracellular solute-binding protein [Desulfobacterales bacterium]|nr:extracellular solute-binding protein [Desulfobacterales bacterium]